MILRPFFPFYGSKWRSAPFYPAPAYSTIIEPFAGSAGYSLTYPTRNIVLVDADPTIAALWRYLIRVSPDEILRLPDIEPGEDVHDRTHLPEARALIGFWINRGSSTPKRLRSAFSSRTDKAQLVWGGRARERIAAQLPFIRHWRIIEGSYENVDAPPSTFFIDPPYLDKGRYYRYRNIDYARLAMWCKERRGQVIVCENAGATWLPFEPLATIKATRGTSQEVSWVNHG